MNLIQKGIFRLWQPIDIAPLVFFRIAFGILAFADILNSLLYYHIYGDAYGKVAVQFPYIGFEWVRPLPEPIFTLFIGIGILASIGVIAGFLYIWSATLVFVIYTYIFLLEKSFYLNHAYLFCWIAFLMIFVPAQYSFSYRVWKKPSEYRSQVPFFWLFPFPALMAVVYFYGGLAKLNSDWFQAEPLRSWLRVRSDMPVIGSLISQEWTAWFMSYGGLLFDLTIVFFLLSRRFRLTGFWVVIFFHGLNHLVFNIGIFPFLSIVLTLLFFPPESHMQFWKKLSNRFSITRKWWQSWTERLHLEAEISTTIPSVATKKFLNICLALILIFHLTIPFRHHLYPGDVAWTEEGHKYAWRMKLRSKHGYGYFEIEDKTTGERTRIEPEKELTKRQIRYLTTHPDVAWQYAQILKERYAAKGQEVTVYAYIHTRLNTNPYRQLIDPEVDLGQVKWHHFRHSPWILR